jgi:hypothetical protein
LSSIDRLLGGLADALLTTIAPDAAGWRRPFRLQTDGWMVEYRVDPAKRRILVMDVRRAVP